MKCPACSSFFAAEKYDPEREARDGRTQTWGNIETGIALGQAKQPMFEAILRALRSAAPPGGTLLDVGCSYGAFMERARDAGYLVRGVDLLPEAVDYVRKRGLICDRAASVRDLDISEASQDVVSVLDCNYYWANQRCELRAISARLRPGGLLVMRVADTSWMIRMALEIGRAFPTTGRKLFERAVYDHRVCIPVHSLLQVLREEGFSTIYSSVLDAIPVRHHNLRARAAYAVGSVSWRLAGINLAPGMVLLSRKGRAHGE